MLNTGIKKLYNNAPVTKHVNHRNHMVKSIYKSVLG